MTIKDVAKKCGVSVSTVSRVMNNHPDVSDDVRKRVTEVVKELHFVPNNSARDLTRQQTAAIGVIVRGASNPFFTQMIHTMEEEIKNTEYTLVLDQIKADADELAAGASLARSKRLKGLIFLGGRYDYNPKQVAMLGVPFVCCTFTNSFGTLKEDAFSSVSIDDREEAKRAVEYLISHGHQKIAILLDSISDSSVCELRYMGYKEALQEAGIEPDPELVQETGGFDMESAYEGMKNLLSRRNDFTAVFIVADSMAIAAMKALQEAGREIPDDCSIISIDGIELSLYTSPTLTTLIQPRDEMAIEAVSTLIRMIRNNETETHLRFETVLREGGTVCDKDDAGV